MMLRLASGQFSPRVSVDGPRLSNALSFSPLKSDGLSRKSVTYNRLPEEPMKLTVRKLDGSCFDIEVPKMATIAELKLAVEAAFQHLPKMGPGKISWPHVWGHFCLSFQGRKLVIDSDYIKNFHIKDGCQLEFIRHISSKCNLTKKGAKKGHSDYLSIEQDESLSPSGSIDAEQEQNKLQDHDLDDMENGRYGYFDNDDESSDGHNESISVNCWSCVAKRKGKALSARFDCGFLCSFRRLLQLCDSRHYTRTNSWKDDSRVDVWRQD